MSGFSENFGWRAGFGCPALYAHEARAVVRKKEEDSVQQKLEKAGRELERAKKVAIRERKKI